MKTSPYILNSPAQVLQYLLIQLMWASLPQQPPSAWPVYLNVEPPTQPDNCITVSDSPIGMNFGRDQVSGEMVEYHGCQILIRSINPLDGRRKGDELRKLMDLLTSNPKLDSNGNPIPVTDVEVTVDGNKYLVHSVNRRDLLYLGYEKSSPGNSAVKKSNRQLWSSKIQMIGLDLITEP